MEENNYDTVVSLDNQNQFMNVNATNQQFNNYNNQQYTYHEDPNQYHNMQNLTRTQYPAEVKMQTDPAAIQEGNYQFEIKCRFHLSHMPKKISNRRKIKDA